MKDTIKTTWQGIEIEYDERQNKWVFTLRGQERSAESLAKAKEIIDKPEPKEKKPFTRIKAWHREYSSLFAPCEVTSIADAPSYSCEQYVWIVKDGNRSREYARNICPMNPHNDALVAEHAKIQAEIDALTEKRNKLAEKATCLKIEPETP